MGQSHPGTEVDSLPQKGLRLVQRILPQEKHAIVQRRPGRRREPLAVQADARS
jgi:hypothetical protein